ncbi:MAG: serine protease [Myxococcota bacterium]|jgi:serine protease
MSEEQFEPRIAAVLPGDLLPPRAIERPYPLEELFPHLEVRGTVTFRFPLAIRFPKSLRRVTEAAKRDPDWTPPLWQRHVWIIVTDETPLEDVVRLLGERVDGTEAFVELEPFPAAPLSPGDPFSEGQGYLDLAPRGVDAAHAWTRPGGTGKGVDVWIVEQAFPDHQGVVALDDLPVLTIEQGASCHPDPAVLASNRRHGARTLGVLGATHGQGAFAGMCPDARLHLVCERPSVCSGTGACCRAELANTLLWIASNANRGDVVLIESQVKVDDKWLTDKFERDVIAEGGDPDWFAPVEVDPANYDIIRTLTAMGVTVVEPAGNGGLSLETIRKDGLLVFGGRPDSGAVMVGAARADHRTPSASSNRGRRVNCWAWGDSVWTTSWTPFNPKAAVAHNYSGTSSASAIIAGCAAIVQGVYTARHGVPLDARALRSHLEAPDAGTPATREGLLLDAVGTPVEADGTPDPTGFVTDVIGVMPDLAEVLRRVDDRSDVVIRDRVGDDGVARGLRPTSSPDIIVLRSAGVPADPATHWAGDAESMGHPPAAVHDGDAHTAYLRVYNRGAVAAARVRGHLWHAPVATLIPPCDWTDIGPTVWHGQVPPDGSLAVSEPIDWPAKALPKPGPRAFVAIVSAPGDPGPSPADLGDWKGYLSAVTSASNLAIRNTHFITGAGPDLELAGEITGAPGDAIVFSLDTLARLPARATPELEVPEGLAQLLRIRASRTADDTARGVVRVPLRPGRTVLGRGRLPADARFPVVLRPGLPATFRSWWMVAVRQSYDGTEVGRITWRLRH